MPQASLAYSYACPGQLVPFHVENSETQAMRRYGHIMVGGPLWVTPHSQRAVLKNLLAQALAHEALKSQALGAVARWS